MHSQTYYGDAIRCTKGDVDKTMKVVQASLLHSNSTNERKCHHLCPEEEESRCKWQVAKALGQIYHHKKPPIPDAIVKHIQPIYSRLGSRWLHSIREQVIAFGGLETVSQGALPWKIESSCNGYVTIQ